MLHAIIPQPCDLRFTGGVCPVQRPQIFFDAAVAPEGYVLTVSKEGVRIRCSTDKGSFYAAQTLRQLQTGNTLPCCVIRDAPRFSYRAFMLDSARHMQTLDEIKRLIDAAALYKFNVFHWHLSDDQGYRMESERFPRLNEVSSFRTMHGFGSLDRSRYGGFYTKAQIREIVAYCAARQITVVPEIDLPGHTKAILTAFPALSCRGEPVQPETRAGVFREILCAGSDETFRFCCALLDEVCELFPGPLFHIGGDEAPKHRWQQCDACKARMAQAHLASFEALQGDFINRLASHLRQRGKRTITWNESLQGGNLAPDVITADWMDRENLCARRANGGGDVIMEDFFHYYLDYPYGMTPLKKTYCFDPLPQRLTEGGKQHVLGVETPLWTEYVEDFRHLCEMMFPRMMAVAERGWTPDAQSSHADFSRRAEAHRPLLSAMGIDMLPQDCWDPQPLARLKKLVQHYKQTFNKETILSFLQPKDDPD